MSGSRLPGSHIGPTRIKPGARQSHRQAPRSRPRKVSNRTPKHENTRTKRDSKSRFPLIALDSRSARKRSDSDHPRRPTNHFTGRIPHHISHSRCSPFLAEAGNTFSPLFLEMSVDVIYQHHRHQGKSCCGTHRLPHGTIAHVSFAARRIRFDPCDATCFARCCGQSGHKQKEKAPSHRIFPIPGSDVVLHRLHRASVMDPVVPKRPCPSADPSSSFDASSSPFRVPSGPMAMDRVLEALLALPDPSVALELSLESLLDSRLLESDKDRLIEGAMEAGSALLEAARRSARRRASKHNFSSWPLASDLTIKVNRLPRSIDL
ncbi:hypothetical protein B296_00036639 [Ensete ventricosum]|uniref:Uncharacterized protein n=1 Tax=Ensete ventricosum TaxID=4639 RepID=A0A426YZS6_ENSVE|nr:hypothetical protein B296_00036639 [Ensete ventricosum]